MVRRFGGLWFLGLSLVVSAGVIVATAHHELDLQRTQLRAHGVALSQALSRVPLARLVPDGGGVGPLQLLKVTQAESLLAYTVVSDEEGSELASFRLHDWVIPPPVVGGAPHEWSGERLLAAEQGRPAIREFAAPLIEQGVMRGSVRTGFLEPHAMSAMPGDEISYRASIALLVFLLAPAAAFWMRRETAPVEAATARLIERVRGAHGSPPSRPEELAAELERSVDELDERRRELDAEKIEMLASTKLEGRRRQHAEGLIEALPNAVLCLDARGGVQYANARAEVLLRQTRDELIGADVGSWAPSEDLNRFVKRLAGGELRRSERLECTTGEASERHLVVHAVPLRDGDGILLDLRDRTSEFVAQQNQVELLGNMAHELKAPLNVIGLYAESLLGPEADDEAYRVDACNVLRDEVDRLGTLINTLFSISKLEGGGVSLERQRIRMKEFLDSAFESVSRGGAELELRFESEISDSLSPIFADKHLLGVAVQNLLTNAIKYNRKGGSVTLAAEEDDSGLRIRVTDTGVGIAEEDIDRLFDKFYRSDDAAVRKVSGHGLGLALVREVVTLHGGELGVQSTLGTGSEFTIRFARNSAAFREDS